MEFGREGWRESTVPGRSGEFEVVFFTFDDLDELKLFRSGDMLRYPYDLQNKEGICCWVFCCRKEK